MQLTNSRLNKDALRVLNNPFWIAGLLTNVSYERIQDDHDGTKEGRLILQIGADGDVWFNTDKHHTPMRFRSFGGGGQSRRVRNALMILALAIKLDNEERPQE